MRSCNATEVEAGKAGRYLGKMKEASSLGLRVQRALRKERQQDLEACLKLEMRVAIRTREGRLQQGAAQPESLAAERVAVFR